MGKKGKPQGRAGQKQKAQKAGKSSSSPWSQKYGPAHLQAWEDSDDEPQRQFRGFAQNSPRTFSPRDPLVKLRHQTIQFVSAGSDSNVEEELVVKEDAIAIANGGEENAAAVNGSKSKTSARNKDAISLSHDAPESSRPPQEALAMMTIDETSRVEIGNDPAVQLIAPIATLEKEHESEAAPKDDILFVVDTVGDASLAESSSSRPQLKNPIIRASSPAPSSSEEEVVFQGRKPRPRVTRVIDESVIASHASAKSAKPRENIDSESATKKPIPPITLDGEDGDAAETIAALTAEVKQILKEKRLLRAKGRAGDTIPLATTETKRNRRGKRGRKKGNRELRNSAWVDVDDDDNDDDEAAYDDYMANLAAQMDADDSGLPSVFTRSELIGGASMMVDGRAYGANEVLDLDDIQVEKSEESSVASDAFPQFVKADDEDDNEDDEDDDDDSNDDDEEVDVDFVLSDLNSSDLEDELEYTEREQWEDEEDIRLRRIAGMQDEQIARLLAKQQELGIEGDDLILDDGYYAPEDEAVEGIGDIDEALAGLDGLAASAFLQSSKRSTPKRRGKGGLSFPSASLLADTVEQYGEAGFDIMDLDRPSLRPRKKGRKGALPAEVEALSDDDLKETLANQWENDRARKRVKKAEREELRQQGLLGSAARKGKPDLSQKYLEGLNMKQVMDEIQIFLQDDGMQSRPFPPMDSTNRRKLHEIASAFNLKSKSVGAGKDRFPVLYKTKVSLEYDEAHFRRVMMASSRGFLKVTSRGTKPAKRNRAGAGGGFDRSAVELRNGEVVGANAAEISVNSFGHKLMEKMGWTRGTALGKDGEGMLTPVAQVMRYGKAGLG